MNYKNFSPNDQQNMKPITTEEIIDLLFTFTEKKSKIFRYICFAIIITILFCMFIFFIYSWFVLINIEGWFMLTFSLLSGNLIFCLILIFLKELNKFRKENSQIKNNEIFDNLDFFNNEILFQDFF